MKARNGNAIPSRAAIIPKARTSASNENTCLLQGSINKNKLQGSSIMKYAVL